MVEEQKEKRYTVKAASQATGLTPDTLRAWERRYRAVVPLREGKGRRLYTQEQVARLGLLSRATRLGHPIRLMATLGNEELQSLVDEQQKRENGSIAENRSKLVEELIKDIENHDRFQFEQKLNRYAAVLPLGELIFGVMLPLLRKVGDCWHAGELTVGQEHLVSTSMRNLLGGLMRIFPASETAPVMTFATLSGERHEFGVLVCALLAASRGYSCNYLGADTPPEDVAAIARATGSRVVCVSVTQSKDTADAAASIELLIRELNGRAEVWFGGEGAEALRGKAGSEGAQFLADIQEFHNRIQNLLPIPPMERAAVG